MLSGINPQGCYVANFKGPTAEALAHDFLWRVHRRTPAKGYIAVFNRSHYEDVLVARVHGLVPASLIEARYGHINAFEKVLYDHGTRVVKVFLHISKEYQLERMRRRLEKPDKLWKFTPEDLKECELWDSYMEAYEIALNCCSTPCVLSHAISMGPAGSMMSTILRWLPRCDSLIEACSVSHRPDLARATSCCSGSCGVNRSILGFLGRGGKSG